MTLTTHLTTSIEEASLFIKRGELVAFPTETVYGLGGSALNPDSIKRIYIAKERPQDNPLIVHIYDLGQLASLVREVTPSAEKLIESFFPGPLTVILERSDEVPKTVSAGLPSIAIRMPKHSVALDFLEACAVPIAAPSANRSGRPSPTTWQDVYGDLKGRISCILQGEQSQVGLESTVVDCRFSPPRILREGGVPIEVINETIPVERISAASSGPSPSPGVKYKHYAPRAMVHIVRSPQDVSPQKKYAYIGIDEHELPDQIGLHVRCTTIEEYAYQLFNFFRRCDRLGLTDIYCQETTTTRLGAALMDRIRKASKQ